MEYLFGIPIYLYSLMACTFGIAICVRWGLGGVELRREKIGIDLSFMAYTLEYIFVCVLGVGCGMELRREKNKRTYIN